MNKLVKWLNKKEAEILNLKVKENEANRKQARYYLTQEQWDFVLRQRTKQNKRKFEEKQKKLNKKGKIELTVEKLQS